MFFKNKPVASRVNIGETLEKHFNRDDLWPRTVPWATRLLLGGTMIYISIANNNKTCPDLFFRIFTMFGHGTSVVLNS